MIGIELSAPLRLSPRNLANSHCRAAGIGLKATQRLGKLLIFRTVQSGNLQAFVQTRCTGDPRSCPQLVALSEKGKIVRGELCEYSDRRRMEVGCRETDHSYCPQRALRSLVGMVGRIFNGYRERSSRSSALWHS